jgi:hypothetical protein
VLHLPLPILRQSVFSDRGSQNLCLSKATLASGSESATCTRRLRVRQRNSKQFTHTRLCEDRTNDRI